MSHLTCPKCQCKEHTVGYGFAAGPLGSYTFCDGCDILLEFNPDVEGISEERTKAAYDKRNEYMKELWGPQWKE